MTESDLGISDLEPEEWELVSFEGRETFKELPLINLLADFHGKLWILIYQHMSFVLLSNRVIKEHAMCIWMSNRQENCSCFSFLFVFWKKKDIVSINDMKIEFLKFLVNCAHGNVPSFKLFTPIYLLSFHFPH